MTDKIKVSYDVVVIGGGIHGAGVAQAAAAQGYSVCLIEQSDIASGTSSKSSKLIHGGLRYLESGQFSLVRECLQERQYLLNNAPHLVSLKPFIIPIYQQTKRRPATIRAGLSLYAMLNGFRKSGLFKSIRQNHWSELDGLSQKDLQHVFQYWDAQTDDKRLTQAVAKSAMEMGCDTLKKTKVTGLNFNSQTKRWHVDFERNNTLTHVESKVVVNATGPWVNRLLTHVNPRPEIKPVDLVQGTHIVLDGELCQGIYYLESPIDQRAIFVMPWYGKTLIGTTEKSYEGDPGKVRASQEEINYLIDSVKFYFPKYDQLQVTDVVEAFAGLRVLPAAEGVAFSRPRETDIFEDRTKAPGLFSIYGGKLTAYRATSALTVRRFSPLLPATKCLADTRYLKLPE